MSKSDDEIEKLLKWLLKQEMNRSLMLMVVCPLVGCASNDIRREFQIREFAEKERVPEWVIKLIIKYKRN